MTLSTTPAVPAFRTFRCTSCGKEQPDAGQIGAGCDTGTCLICGTFWALELIWPQTSSFADADEGA